MKKYLTLLSTIILLVIPAKAHTGIVIFHNNKDEYVYYKYLYSVNQDGIKSKNSNIAKWSEKNFILFSNSRRYASFTPNKGGYSYFYWTYKKQENEIFVYSGPTSVRGDASTYGGGLGESVAIQSMYGINYSTFHTLYFSTDFTRMNIVTQYGLVHVFEKSTEPTEQSAPRQLY